jgi:hypothetical protein
VSETSHSVFHIVCCGRCREEVEACERRHEAEARRTAALHEREVRDKTIEWEVRTNTQTDTQRRRFAKPNNKLFSFLLIVITEIFLSPWHPCD